MDSWWDTARRAVAADGRPLADPVHACLAADDDRRVAAVWAARADIPGGLAADLADGLAAGPPSWRLAVAGPRLAGHPAVPRDVAATLAARTGRDGQLAFAWRRDCPDADGADLVATAGRGAAGVRAVADATARFGPLADGRKATRAALLDLLGRDRRGRDLAVACQATSAAERQAVERRAVQLVTGDAAQMREAGMWIGGVVASDPVRLQAAAAPSTRMSSLLEVLYGTGPVASLVDQSRRWLLHGTLVAHAAFLVRPGRPRDRLVELLGEAPDLFAGQLAARLVCNPTWRPAQRRRLLASLPPDVLVQAATSRWVRTRRQVAAVDAAVADRGVDLPPLGRPAPQVVAADVVGYWSGVDVRWPRTRTFNRRLVLEASAWLLTRPPDEVADVAVLAGDWDDDLASLVNAAAALAG